MNAAQLIDQHQLVLEERDDGEFYFGRVENTREAFECIWAARDWCPVRPFGASFLREVWISVEHMLVLTYCEGDLRLAVHKDAEEFFAALTVAAKFYKEH